MQGAERCRFDNGYSEKEPRHQEMNRPIRWFALIDWFDILCGQVRLCRNSFMCRQTHKLATLLMEMPVLQIFNIHSYHNRSLLQVITIATLCNVRKHMIILMNCI